MGDGRLSRKAAGSVRAGLRPSYHGKHGPWRRASLSYPVRPVPFTIMHLALGESPALHNGLASVVAPDRGRQGRDQGGIRWNRRNSRYARPARLAPKSRSPIKASRSAKGKTPSACRTPNGTSWSGSLKVAG